MPAGRVILKRQPISPGRNAKYTIRRNPNQSGAWWVYYEPRGADRIPADAAHRELVTLVNSLKEAEGNQPGGSFSINEHQQVIVRMRAPAAYGGNAIHVVGLDGGKGVTTYTKLITFQGGALNPTALPTEGDTWPGPLCGMSYMFAAPGNPQIPSKNLDEISVKIDGVTTQLSTDAALAVYPPPRGPLADFLAALRHKLPGGGRFRVNEYGRAFTPAGDIFIGQVPIAQWFKPLTPKS